MSDEQNRAAEGSSAANQDLVTRLWQEIWIDNDFTRLRELVSDPYVRHTRDGTVSSTPAEYARHIESAVQSIKSTAVDIDDLTSVGDRVYARLRLRGVNLTTGDELHLTWLAHYRIVDGRVAESWSMHQTGLDW